MRKSLVAIAITIAMIGGVGVGTADASGGNGESVCSFNGGPTQDPGPIGGFISFIAQEFGHSADNNPGNAMNDAPPFVAFIAGCNPS